MEQKQEDGAQREPAEWRRKGDYLTVVEIVGNLMMSCIYCEYNHDNTVFSCSHLSVSLVDVDGYTRKERLPAQCP